MQWRGERASTEWCSDYTVLTRERVLVDPRPTRNEASASFAHQPEGREPGRRNEHTPQPLLNIFTSVGPSMFPPLNKTPIRPFSLTAPASNAATPSTPEGSTTSLV